MTRQCCAIGCDDAAEFEIWDGNEQRPDVAPTDACERHVGFLLGSVPPTKPTGPWRVCCIADDCADTPKEK